MKNVIVTGGAGYIGSHVCKIISKNGYNPIVYDNLSTGHRKFVKWGPFIKGDIIDFKKIKSVLLKYKAHAVIHLAAFANVRESLAQPYKYYLNNVYGSLSLLRAMKEAKINFIVFSSSSSVYGSPNTKVIDEQTATNPINPYGLSKLFFEKILNDISMETEIKFIALRYFNAAGADKDLEIGELPLVERRIIPIAIKSAFNGPKLKIFGKNFKTPDGTAIRDYVHVEDLAKGHLLALNYLLSGGKSNLINLGSGKGCSIKEILNLLNQRSVKVNYDYHDKINGEPDKLVASNKKAIKILKWRPSHNIEQILDSSIKWYKKIYG